MWQPRYFWKVGGDGGERLVIIVGTTFARGHTEENEETLPRLPVSSLLPKRPTRVGIELAALGPPYLGKKVNNKHKHHHLGPHHTDNTQYSQKKDFKGAAKPHPQARLIWQGWGLRNPPAGVYSSVWEDIFEEWPAEAH